MQELFTSLSHAVQGAPIAALAASFVWGVLSVILSPCHLASIPLIVGFISGQGRLTTRRASALASLFALGILATIAAIGALTAAAGRMMGDLGRWGNYFVALIFLAVGLHLLGLIPMPWSGPSQPGTKRKGLLAALLLGLIFGIALGPCTFAFMAPVLGVAFKSAQTSALYASALLLAYGVGHCAGHKMKTKVLLLCTGNSCRSQMAEAWTHRLKGDRIEPFSAGIEKHGLNPHALKVMAEAGVDMSGQYSKTLSDLGPLRFDYVITVCGHAREHCPVFPGKTKVLHVGFDDPPALATVVGVLVEVPVMLTVCNLCNRTRRWYGPPAAARPNPS